MANRAVPLAHSSGILWREFEEEEETESEANSLKQRAEGETDGTLVFKGPCRLDRKITVKERRDIGLQLPAELFKG